MLWQRHVRNILFIFASCEPLNFPKISLYLFYQRMRLDFLIILLSQMREWMQQLVEETKTNKQTNKKEVRWNHILYTTNYTNGKLNVKYLV